MISPFHQSHQHGATGSAAAVRDLASAAHHARFHFSFVILHFAFFSTVLLLSGCGENMALTGRLKPYEPTRAFTDGLSARPLPAHTVPHTDHPLPRSSATGLRDGKPLTELPVPLTRALLDRGRERYTIYCAVCHGADGAGRGMIVQRGFPPPPSFHSEALRAAPPGHIVNVIAAGRGAMYPYEARVAPPDRWAIAAYIRALQLSQNARLDDLPPSERAKLQETSR